PAPMPTPGTPVTSSPTPPAPIEITPIESIRFEQQIGAVLDDFHDAASKADESRYFAHFAPEGVFLGTDATERWTVPQFRAYAKPHFDNGKGWTYRSTARVITICPVNTPGAEVAWFDELLANDRLGVTRGSGVLRRIDGVWRIAQYNLSIPIPNDLADDTAARIRAKAP
ncbi:MAG: nuclear transport factor 2 family protein, partial [Planctomycetes bacterium]|nr:nuclear transport factor 2 family protein [Planctomycetota bacterium]